MTKWNISACRVTLFPVPTSPLLLDALALYRLIWSADPDNFQKQGNPLMPSTAMGERGSGISALAVVQAARIDLNLAATPQSTIPPGEDALPIIRNPLKLNGEMKRIFDAVGTGAISNSLTRVALYIQFQSFESSVRDANSALRAVIPRQYGINITDEEDVIFQVNRRFVGQANLTMNAITKWSVDHIQIFNFVLPLGGQGAFTPMPPPANVLKPGALNFTVAGVNFEINNVPSETLILNGAQQASILTDALTRASKMQDDIGLSIEGF
jgi:hypothetical protein